MSEGTDRLESQLHPRAGCWILAAPIVMAALIVGGYGSLLVAGYFGTPASGEVVTLDFVGCPEAKDVVAARVAEIGLGDPVLADTPTGFTLVARFPAEPDAAAEIPATLARTGAFAVRAGEEPDGSVVVDESRIETATFKLDLSATASTGVQLDAEGTAALLAHQKAHPEDVVSLWVDGAPAGKLRNDPPERAGRIDLEPQGKDGLTQLREAAARGIVLSSGPLPCQLSVTRRE